MSAVALDHVGVVGRDLDSLAQEFSRIGFALTPLAAHAGGRTGNRCAMLRSGYIELMAVLPGGASATLDRFLAHHAGAHTAALAIANPQAEHARLQRAGFAPIGVMETERLVDAAEARFTVLLPADQPEGRFLLVHHHTPETLWQDRFLHHPNHAVALAELLLACTDPADAAARLSRLAGRPLHPDPCGGYALALQRGTLRLLPAAVAASLLPGIALPEPPCIAGITLHTDDRNMALRRLLQQQRIAHLHEDAAVVVAAGGVGLRFVADSP